MNIKKYQITNKNKSKILYLGFFDALHKGHLRLFGNIKNRGVLTFINIPRKSEPVFDVEKRICDLKRLGFKKIYIYDIVNNNVSGKEFIKNTLVANNVEKIIVGEDFKIGNDFIDVNIIKKFIDVDVIKKDDNSTTTIKKLLRDGKIDEANKLLAFNFSIKSKVIKEKQIARTLGFATANVNSYNSHYLKQGVYKTHTIFDDKKYKSITFIGNNKTFENNKYTIETHIINFDQNIYNKEIDIIFDKYICEIEKFNSVSELKKHIAKLVNERKKED